MWHLHRPNPLPACTHAPHTRTHARTQLQGLFQFVPAATTTTPANETVEVYDVPWTPNQDVSMYIELRNNGWRDLTVTVDLEWSPAVAVPPADTPSSSSGEGVLMQCAATGT